MIARLAPLVFAALVLVVPVIPGHPVRAARLIYVNYAATGAKDGTSWTNAYTDLQAALGTASSGDEVWVAAGTYRPTSGTSRSVSFQMETGLAIYGGFAGTEAALTDRDPKANLTVLSGDIGTEGNQADNSYHVVAANNADGTAVLDGFTVRDGNASEYLANDGGGMYVSGGSPSVTNVIFSGNLAADRGGGLAVGVGASVTVTDTAFTDNHSGQGGGMDATDGSMWSPASSTLTNVTFTGNTASRFGGGLAAGGRLRLTNATITENRAVSGGGLAVGEADFVPDSDNAVLTNITVVGNTGGGLEVFTGDPLIANSIFWGNTGAQIYAPAWNSLRFVVAVVLIGTNVVEGGCPLGILCDALVTADPRLGALADNGGATQTIALAVDSPAIDVGTDDFCPATDQRGVGRPKDGPDADTKATCDLGAYEYFVPVVGFAAAGSTRSEVVTSRPVRVQLSSPHVQPVTVRYRAMGGTAHGGGRDYTLSAGTLTFAPGDTSESIPVIVTDDMEVERDETVAIALSDARGAVLGAGTHTLTIVENEPPLKCGGKTATMVGTEGNDRLTGTVGVDVIVGRGGNDVIEGRGGADVLCGTQGSDAIYGGGGDDVLLGGDGNDNLSGGPGRDVLIGVVGDDVVSGGPGDDLLHGGGGRDQLRGEEGVDTLRGESSDDRLAGGPGPGDACIGGPGTDALLAGHGCETVAGVP